MTALSFLKERATETRPESGHADIKTLLDVQETERARIARELHDSLGQKLARQRVEPLDGTMAVTMREAGGTGIRVQIPVTALSFSSETER